MALRGLIGLALALSVASCEEAKEALSPAPSPEEISARQEAVTQELRQAISPVTAVLNAEGYGENGQQVPGYLTDEAKVQALGALRDAKKKCENSEEGKAALVGLGHEITGMLQKARDDDRWRVVLALVEAHQIATGEVPDRMARLKERAQIQFDRPQVELKGFFDDLATGQTYVFLRLRERGTGKVHMVQARVGDEFHELRLLKIIGKKRGVELEYLKVPDETFKVMKS
jgi:hypothetical protein